ncbi:MAG: hypothetical protein LH468_12620 [Nocardioides sp.]|nr:hypothetical protein [Nocardioides sp.]
MLKLLILVLVIAVAVYFTIRALQQDGAPTPKRRPRTRPPERVQGPDDDDDFLRDLDRRRKHPEDPDA